MYAKVWAVEHIYYDDCYVHALYTTEDLANQVKDELNAIQPTRAYYEVTEMEVFDAC